MRCVAIIKEGQNMKTQTTTKTKFKFERKAINKFTNAQRKATQRIKRLVKTNIENKRFDLEKAKQMILRIHYKAYAKTTSANVPTWEKPIRIVYKRGNKKLPKTTLLINTESALLCSSAKAGLCSLYKIGACYALRDNVRFPKSFAYNCKQEKVFQTLSANDIANDIITISKHKKVLLVRFNESGDLKNNNELEKLNTIATLLAKHKIKVYIYTHNTNLDLSIATSENLVINSSVATTKATNQYIALDVASKKSFERAKRKNKIQGKTFACDCDCKKCNTCAFATNTLILVDLH